MKKISLNLERFIKKIPKKNIIERVAREAIANSLQANATNIICSFITDNHLFSNQKEYAYLSQIIVEDDGDGFNDENLASFSEYGSEYKLDQWGSKGTGRFAFLKVSNQISYVSHNKKITLNIHGIHIEEEKSTDLTTLVIKLNDEENHECGHKSIEKIRHSIFIQLLPMLILIKEKDNKSFSIVFKIDNEEVASIASRELPQCSRTSFSLEDFNNEKVKFDLIYFLDKTTGKAGAFQCAKSCADYIAVLDIGIEIKLPQEYSYLFLLQSSYLNSRVNDSRDNFTFHQKEKDIDNPINWEEIDFELKKQLDKIIRNKIPTLEEENQKTYKLIEKSFPFFQAEMRDMELKIVGFLSIDDCINSSYKTLDKIKEKIRKLQIRSFHEGFDDELLKHSSLELAEYVISRQIIINEMQELINQNTDDEAKIHEILLPKGVGYNSDNNIANLSKNNLWLIDDKFMTFSKALSDQKIKQLKKELMDKNTDFLGSSQEPDIMIYFDSDKQNKLVTIEIKSFCTKNLSDRKKIDGVTQLTEYVDFINTEFSDVCEKWYYLITTVDDSFRRQLKNFGYQKLFSYGEIYFSFNATLRTHIYILDMQTLLQDANSRNSVFLNVLTKAFESNIEKREASKKFKIQA